jgi:hypothetical protein
MATQEELEELREQLQNEAIELAEHMQELKRKLKPLEHRFNQIIRLKDEVERQLTKVEVVKRRSGVRIGKVVAERDLHKELQALIESVKGDKHDTQ